MSSPQWMYVCEVQDIPVLGARVVRRKMGSDIALFRAADDHVFALLDSCPHKGGPLSQGIVHGHKVACPLHNWNIELANGQATAPDEGCTPSFAVLVQDGKVMMDKRELSTIQLAVGDATKCAA